MSVIPAAILIVNNDLTSNVEAMLVTQLHIDEVIDGVSFDARVANDPTYNKTVHSSGQRIMVVRSLFETNNRELADLVLFVKAGLASSELNKFGPPGITTQVVNIDWGKFCIFYTR